MLIKKMSVLYRVTFQTFWPGSLPVELQVHLELVQGFHTTKIKH